MKPPTGSRAEAKSLDSRPAPVEVIQGFVCPFCGRPMFRRMSVPKQLNLIWYCSGCEKRANDCDCMKPDKDFP